MSLFDEELRHRIDEENQRLAAAIAADDEDLADALRADLDDLRAFAARHGAKTLIDA